MDKYNELLRQVLNEINVGGKDIDNENDDDNDNFMDDGGNDNNDQSTDDTAGSDDAGGDDDDVGAGESDNFMDDDSGGDDTGDAGSDDAGEDDDVGAGESDNFMDDDSGGDDEGGDDAGGDDSGEGEEDTGDDNTEETNEEEDYDLDKIEDELFSSLTPEQIAIKNHELKQQFIEVYTIIGSTLVRINDIPKSNDNINILKFITEKLLELREMIDYNITTAYATRTYIENNIIYQQCIATLNAIADIIDNIPNVNGGESNAEKTEENEEDDKGVPVEPDDTQQVKSLDVSDSSMSDYQEESTDYNSLF